MTLTFTSADTQVLIAGAGPVGLALALDLGRQSISVIVLDGDPESNTSRRNRRANAINTRSMEYLRRLGVSDEIHDRSELARRQVLDVGFITSLSGHEITRFVDAFQSSPEPAPSDLSPERYLRIDQDEICAILRHHIANCPGVDIRVGWRLASMEQDDAGVRVVAENIVNGSAREISAEWLIGADGGSSVVRKAAALGLAGEGQLGENINITCRAPVMDAVNRHADACMYWLVNPDIRAFCGSDGNTFRLTVMDVTPEEEAAIRANPDTWLTAASGTPVAPEILSIDRWTAHQLVAKDYRAKRVFIAGDAAHLHPPTGGLGMNTGLGDASNLGWKLGAAIHGWGGDRLLDSYTEERQPHGATVVAQANLQYKRVEFFQPGLDKADSEGEALRAVVAQEIRKQKSTEFFSRGLVLGQTYRSGVIVPNGEPVLNTDVINYEPTAQPGARLPNAIWRGRSIYDALAVEGLTLLAIGEAASFLAEASCAAAHDAAIPLTLVNLPGDFRTPYQADLLLVRPDAHVAWRGSAAPDKDILRQVTGAR